MRTPGTSHGRAFAVVVESMNWGKSKQNQNRTQKPSPEIAMSHACSFKNSDDNMRKQALLSSLQSEQGACIKTWQG